MSDQPLKPTLRYAEIRKKYDTEQATDFIKRAFADGAKPSPELLELKKDLAALLVILDELAQRIDQTPKLVGKLPSERFADLREHLRAAPDELSKLIPEEFAGLSLSRAELVSSVGLALLLQVLDERLGRG